MKILNLKKVTPMSSGIITTANKYTEEECTHLGIIDTAKLGQIKDVQTVVSPSKYAQERGIAEGSDILINFIKYSKTKQKKNSLKQTMDEYYDNIVSYEIPSIVLNGVEHLHIDVGDVAMIVNDYEYTVEGEGLLAGDSTIVLN